MGVFLDSLIYTDHENCTGCGVCVDTCPVDAALLVSDKAQIKHEDCVSCGACLLNCPPKARQVSSDIDKLKAMLNNGSKLAASVAPSFAAAFDQKDLNKLPTALRKLGFQYISEAVEGAVHANSDNLIDASGFNICTGCPASILFIEKHEAEFKNKIMPFVTPMINHGRLLKERLGKDWTVVFIGPCPAKKMEAQRPEYNNSVDYVINFSELISWLIKEGIDISQCAESDFETNPVFEGARLLPMNGDIYDRHENKDAAMIKALGYQRIKQVLKQNKNTKKLSIAELMFCKEGCIAGAGFPQEKSIEERKENLKYYNKIKSKKNI